MKKMVSLYDRDSQLVKEIEVDESPHVPASIAVYVVHQRRVFSLYGKDCYREVVGRVVFAEDAG